MSASLSPYSYRFQHNLKIASIVFNNIVLSLSIVVLCGWQFDIVFLRKPFPGLVAMHPLTAICLALSSVALTLFVKRRSPAAIKVLATMVLVTGVSEMLEYVGILEAHIDNLLYHSKTSRDVINGQSNVMAPLTAFNFVITGVIIILMSIRFRLALCQYLSLIILCLSLFSLVGYIYGVSPFYSFFAYYPMAIHTATCFLLLGVSILFARSNKGFMVQFISPYGGSRLARQLLPVAILVPVVLGLLRLFGEERGLYSRPFGVALFASLSIFIFIAFIWKSMASVNRLSFELSEQKAAQQSNQIGSLIMNAALDAIICLDKEGKITLWNPRAEKIFGWKKEEVIGRTMAEVIIPAHLREKHEQGMRHYLQSGECRLLNDVIETVAIDRNNQELQIELAITRLRHAGREIFCGFIRNITETLKHLHDIEEQNKKLREIAWTQSHIVRAPLANILGLTQLLSDPTLDKETSGEILGHITKSATELDRVIREIVAKAETL